jgi:hypothetical protein
MLAQTAKTQQADILAVLIQQRFVDKLEYQECDQVELFGCPDSGGDIYLLVASTPPSQLCEDTPFHKAFAI